MSSSTLKKVKVQQYQQKPWGKTYLRYPVGKSPHANTQTQQQQEDRNKRKETFFSRPSPSLLLHTRCIFSGRRELFETIHGVYECMGEMDVLTHVQTCCKRVPLRHFTNSIISSKNDTSIGIP